ncbi:hypothetical protein WJX72_003062 [[Myrmecia] bisecta]|uniref:DUF2470 domain-containing protein n=1 Tax=[Myrmecia] bisecta TaxID=41462 RepID=A0AAW1Q351_9CHLO
MPPFVLQRLQLAPQVVLQRVGWTAAASSSRPAVCTVHHHRQATRATSRIAQPSQGMRASQVSEASTSASDQPDLELDAFFKRQQTCARPTPAEDARTLVELARMGTLSTISQSNEAAGYPVAAVLEFAADESGRPLFGLSSLSPQSKDVRQDSRCSFTVTAPNFQGVEDSRFTVTGGVQQVPDEEAKQVREVFRKKYPDSFWFDFGDFSFYRMDRIVVTRLINGFAPVGMIPAKNYLSASPDPVAAFSAPVAGHMNSDHAESIVAMVKAFGGLTVDEAKILSLDRLGMQMQVKRSGEVIKCRLPFVRPVTTRKEIKDVIVEMSKAVKS